MSRRQVLWLGPALFLVLFLPAFGLGVLADRAGWLPGSPPGVPPDAGPAMAPFWETWRLVEKDYVDREAVKPQRMARGAIRGLLDSLGDTGHTSYLTPEEFKRLESGLEGSFEGIGAQLTVRDGEPTILRTFPGTPAREAGLRAGDVIMEVDGKKVEHLSLEQIVELIRGPGGTVVKLRVRRPGSVQPLDISIKRGKVEVPSVVWHKLPGLPIAHIAIREFGNQADSQLEEALRQARDQGAEGLLLDVRGNPGGLLEQAVAVTSEFITEGNVLIEQNAKGTRQPIPVIRRGNAPKIPLVVLIDQGTASAAEIFAGAIQDHKRGKLVGERTFGTGTVLKPFQLSDGSVVLLAIQEWLTPDGRQIWHQGIEPDVEVKLPPGAAVLTPDREENLTQAELEMSQDKQLLEALKVLQKEMGAGKSGPE